MATLNKVMLIGRLTRDPEMILTDKGVKFGFAVNNSKKNPQTGQWEDEPVDDLVDRLAGLQRPAQVGAGLLGGGGTGPVTAAGEVDGGRGEALRRTVPGPGHQSGIHLAQSAGVAEQDQRRRRGCGRPQDAGDLAEGEFAFEDAVVEALFGSESHGRAFRECS